jgi:hypothetical protein
MGHDHNAMLKLSDAFTTTTAAVAGQSPQTAGQNDYIIEISKLVKSGLT